jgi:urate oxidase
MSDSVSLGFNSHGKGRVRLVKVIRKKCGGHDVVQLNVEIALQGDNMEQVYLTGDNSTVVATDTCKNTVYCLAKMHDFASIEDFGIILVKHFLTEYPTIVNQVDITIVKDQWQRLTVPSSKGSPAPHKHAFKRVGPQKFFTKVQGTKRPFTQLAVSVSSGFSELEILKTTQSGFVKFHRNRFTSLPDVADRLLGTSATVTWDYAPVAIGGGSFDFNATSATIESALINTFAGPSDVGVYSASVQQTLYDMGKAALLKAPAISRIVLEMPNIHNIPFPLETYGLTNKDHTGNPTIFFPIDEPHGQIRAEIVRKPKSRL